MPETEHQQAEGKKVVPIGTKEQALGRWIAGEESSSCHDLTRDDLEPSPVKSGYRNVAFCPALTYSRNLLQAQFSRDLNVWQICNEIAEKSSKIVPLGAPFFPMYFVYVLRSETSARHYVGHTSDLTQRLGQHNNGITKSTKNRGPWNLIHQESFPTRPDAMRRERFLKSGQGREELKRLLSAARSAG